MWRALVLLVVTASCNAAFALGDTELVTDRDGDGIPDQDDNCPHTANPNQHDEDLDGSGDPCDLCPGTPDLGEDRDGDGVGDACDPDDGGVDCLRLFDTFGADSAAAFATNWQGLGPAPTISGDALRVTSSVILLTSGFDDGGSIELGGQLALKNGNNPLIGVAHGAMVSDSALTSGNVCGWYPNDSSAPVKVLEAPSSALGSAVLGPAEPSHPVLTVRWFVDTHDSAPTYHCTVHALQFVGVVTGPLAIHSGRPGIVAVDVAATIEYFAAYSKGTACISPPVFR